MRKALAVILSLLMSSVAYAADNAVTVTNGADVNLKSKDLGAGLQLMQHGILDTAGNEILGLLTASPAATSISGRLVTINTTLGSPFQAGGSIGNAFALDSTLTTLSGKLPTSLTTAGADGVSNTLSGLQTYSRLQMFNGTTWDRLIGDTTSGIWVNIKAGAGSGGTALADGATFTQGTTSLTPIGCLFINSYTAITTGKAGVLSCTNAGSLHTTVDNTNANGSATSANSSPVVIASDQAAVAVKAASGAFASGSIASGAIASGAVASGAVASGAYASGSLASGAVVDLTNMSASTGAAPPSKAIYLGANASGATGGQLAGIVQCDSTIAYDASTSGSTQLVALTSGRSVYVCGYTILAAGTVNVKLIYGTGTACATGSANLTPAYQLTTQVGLVDSSPFYRGLKTASANELCINTSAGVAVQALVYYSVI